MRLDVFLKLSRLIPRRSLAQDFCDKGLVKVNGTEAKSSKDIKTGDSIEIARRNAVTKIEVMDVPAKKQLSKTEAQDIFKILSSEKNNEGEF